MSVYEIDNKIYPPLSTISSDPPPDEDGSDNYKLKKFQKLKTFCIKKL